MAITEERDGTEILSRDQLQALIDSEAMRLLKISGDQFRELYHKGAVPKDDDLWAALRLLTMLIDLEDAAAASVQAA